MNKNSCLFALDIDFALAQSIAKKMDMELLIPEVVRFADSEIRIDLEHMSVHGKTAYIIHSTVDPVNESYMKLFFFADLLKRSGAEKVVAVVPYFGYARQCGCKCGEGVGHAKIIANLIECSGVDEVISVEIHDIELESFFSIPFTNIVLQEFIADAIRQRIPDIASWCVVAPDKGAKERVKRVASLLGVNTIFFSKKRMGIDQVELIGMHDGLCVGKNVIIIDDIIDTGNTALRVVEALQTVGVGQIYAYFVHPVISNNAAQKLQNSPIKKIFVTNTVTLNANEKIGKIEVIDIADSIISVLRTSVNN